MRTADGHSAVHLWSLSEEIGIEDDASGDGLVLTGPDGIDRVPEVSPLVREALRRMQLGPVLLTNLAPERARGCAPDEPLPAAGDPGLSRVLASITHLVVRTLAIDDLGGPLLSAFPLSRPAPFSPVRPPPRRAVRMASGVSLTQESDGIAMWSATASHRVLLHRPEAALVVSLLGVAGDAGGRGRRPAGAGGGAPGGHRLPDGRRDGAAGPRSGPAP